MQNVWEEAENESCNLLLVKEREVKIWDNQKVPLTNDVRSKNACDGATGILELNGQDWKIYIFLQ